jgi:hypothetical protein
VLTSFQLILADYEKKTPEVDLVQAMLIPDVKIIKII